MPRHDVPSDQPAHPPDRALVEGTPEPRHGYYAAFIAACNTDARLAMTTSRIHLENAFGTEYKPVETGAMNEFLYESAALAPAHACRPEDRVADSSFPGAALVF